MNAMLVCEEFFEFGSVIDFGKKKGEKVDYAVLKNNKFIMFIEAKPVGSRLDNHNVKIMPLF
ncbi:hypothetical protein LMF89_03845 [Pelosinus sp. Bkl1]|uniref:Uncharacterized protein n=1 Tax=Pelosinus baikalensis TaxID=2892015 RepID=A0ABS8HMW1_9FIRM|nr:hypothetical protein [Pelosinus baikalensis]